MGDLKIKSIHPLSLPRAEKRESTPAAPGSDFKKILSNSIQEVNKLQTQANEAVQGMVLGKIGNLFSPYDGGSEQNDFRLRRGNADANLKMDLRFYNAPRYLVYFRRLLHVIKNVLLGINSHLVGENLLAFQEEVV